MSPGNRGRGVSEPDPVLYSVHQHIATIVINRPERRNALSAQACWGLIEALDRAKADDQVRCVVLTGAGDKAFCAGADLSAQGTPSGALEAHEERGTIPEIFLRAYELGKPTIAKVRGYALAGGFGLALMCDVVIASQDAVFGAPEINVGMWPMMITVPMLRSMPPKVALELQLTGRRVSADEGHALGFVSRVVADGQLDHGVLEFAQGLASRSPAIVRIGRDAFNRVQGMPAREALAYLQLALGLVAQTDDHREGVSAFAEKRPPTWTGH
jgi:enoyl-CoA hydratase/carnithine racemase